MKLLPPGSTHARVLDLATGRRRDRQRVQVALDEVDARERAALGDGAGEHGATAIDPHDHADVPGAAKEEGETRRFKRAFRDGSSHALLDPLTFIARLAALVPRPRAHLVTYHGLFAPAAPLRSRIVPPPPQDDVAPSARPAAATPLLRARIPAAHRHAQAACPQTPPLLLG